MASGKLWVEAWSPEYGSSFEAGGLASSEEEVAPFIEVGDWAPVDPPDLPWPGAAFLDGVSRIDARAFLDAQGSTIPGICGSVAAGSVLVDGSSTYGPSKVVRAAIFGSGHIEDFPVVSQALSYDSRTVPGSRPEDLYLGLQELRAEAELQLAGELAREGWIVVADGAVGVRESLSVVGYIKSHHKAYLSPELEPIIRSLQPGQRTPVFMFGIIRPRYSWYLRLASAEGQHPWAAVVRCEVSAALAFERAVELADITARHLHRFASKPFWDPRAPQNLVPIAALERKLSHLLGDRELVYRRIRSAIQRSAA